MGNSTKNENPVIIITGQVYNINQKSKYHIQSHLISPEFCYNIPALICLLI
jgi:hypothetical protein